MILIIARIEFAGFLLVLLGSVAAAYMCSRRLTIGDVLARARTIPVLRIVVVALRPRWLHRRADPACRPAWSPTRRPAPIPVARATAEPSDDAPRVTGSPAATGTPGPAVPIPPQRGGAVGPALTSADPADAPSLASVTATARDGVLAPAGRDGGKLHRGCGGDRPGATSGGSATSTRGALPPHSIGE